MDFTQDITITSSYLNTNISVKFPSVLDSNMQKGITDLHNKRLSVTRGGRTKVVSFGLRVKFFDTYAKEIIAGVDFPDDADFREFVPVAVKEDIVEQIETATSVSEEETGN